MVLLEFCFLAWGKDTSQQCLEFRRPWKHQYLAERGASASINAAKKKWLRRGLAGTKTGCSAKHPVLSFLKSHESDQLFSINLTASPSSCGRASVCGCGMPAEALEAHTRGSQGSGLCYQLCTILKQWRAWLNHSLFSSPLPPPPPSSLPLSLSPFPSDQLSRVVCSQTRKPLRSSHSQESHWSLQEIHRAAFSFTILTLK